MPAVDRRLVQNFDWKLCGLALALALIGIGNLISAAPGAGGEIGPLPMRQLLWLGLSTLAMVLLLAIDYRVWDRLALPFLALCVVLLVAVLAFSGVVKGSQRWLAFGPMRLQPSELAKLAIVVVMARLVHRRRPTPTARLRELVLPAVLVMIPVALVFRQPDLGSCLLLLLVAGSFLLLVPLPIRSLAWMGAVLGAGACGAWSFYLRGYQKERILTFLNPERDPLGAAYHTIQSQIAVGSGGLLGKGFLAGSQSQLEFLPEQPTDFVFSVLAEEWGFLGAGLVLLLYIVLLLRGLIVARTAKDLFGTALALGAVSMLFWPAAVNLAMVLGLLPVVGIPLPFLSYGGSSLLVSLAAVGLLMNVSMRRYLF
ncbi:MAG: rod shape-determining protein RodA [Myxococcota bacterium]